MSTKDELTNTQIKEYNRKFERGASEPREDLRNYALPFNDSEGASSEADKNQRKLDKESSLSEDIHFLASRLASPSQ